MILICCALHPEAAPLIEHFKLKRDMSVRTQQVFENDNLRLIVSGVGKIASAVAITRLLSISQNLESVAALNIGICGARPQREIGSLLVVNKINDYSAERTYYPDMLLKSKIAEGSLSTLDRPILNGINEHLDLFDMEGAGFFQAAALFLAPSRISLLKVVSDHGVSIDLTKEKVQQLIQNQLVQVESYLQVLESALQVVHDPLSISVKEKLSSLAQSARFTATQRQQLETLARGKAARNGDLSTTYEILTQIAEQRTDRTLSFKRVCDSLLE